MVCCSLGTSFLQGNDCLLLSHKLLRIDVDSTLEGVLPNSTGEIDLQLSREFLLCLGPTGESLYVTGYT